MPRSLIRQSLIPKSVILAGTALFAVLLTLWAMGGFDTLGAWASEGQRQAQNALAGALRRLRANEPGAFMALIGLAFAYGVFHAAGPGHGKVLIGGYGVARRVRLVPLITIAVLSSLAQATTAVALVYTGVIVLNLTRETMVGLADNVLEPISYGAIGLIGIWLAWRGISKLRHRATGQTPQVVGHSPHTQTHDHIHDDACGCNHRHGPTLDDVDRVQGLRDAALLIASVALRPCTGALFLLILTWRMGIDAVGIAGAYAMGLGTASITVAVAVLAVWAREGAIVALSGGKLARALPLMEFTAGLAIALISANLMLRAL